MSACNCDITEAGSFTASKRWKQEDIQTSNKAVASISIEGCFWSPMTSPHTTSKRPSWYRGSTCPNLTIALPAKASCLARHGLHTPVAKTLSMTVTLGACLNSQSTPLGQVVGGVNGLGTGRGRRHMLQRNIAMKVSHMPSVPEGRKVVDGLPQLQRSLSAYTERSEGTANLACHVFARPKI